jgi:hypothetical protein
MAMVSSTESTNEATSGHHMKRTRLRCPEFFCQMNMTSGCPPSAPRQTLEPASGSRAALGGRVAWLPMELTTWR